MLVLSRYPSPLPGKEESGFHCGFPVCPGEVSLSLLGAQGHSSQSSELRGAASLLEGANRLSQAFLPVSGVRGDLLPPETTLIPHYSHHLVPENA